MINSILLHFYLKTPKAYISEAVPNYLKLTVNGKRVEFSIGHKCETSKWCKNQKEFLEIAKKLKP